MHNLNFLNWQVKNDCIQFVMSVPVFDPQELLSIPWYTHIYTRFVAKTKNQVIHCEFVVFGISQVTHPRSHCSFIY